jgi:hypothetical protein
METEKIVAFDYETTGIQPYKKGHEIICMSVATSRKAYAFENTKAILPYIQHFLTLQKKIVAPGVTRISLDRCLKSF